MNSVAVHISVVFFWQGACIPVVPKYEDKQCGRKNVYMILYSLGHQRLGVQAGAIKPPGLRCLPPRSPPV